MPGNSKLKYIMRASVSPFETPSYLEVFKNNYIGGNAGNLLFVNSISRALMKDNTEIDYINTLNNLEDEEIERINEEYDAFIIPLANAFRGTFIEELKRITRLVRKLKIPSIVIGVGLKGGKIGVEYESYPFDEAVKDFCKAVLEKSASIGIRGEITAGYMKKLGFREHVDYSVIGCPSMYFYGNKLPTPKKSELNESSRINLNCKASLTKKIHLYLSRICEQIPDHYYVAQNLYEFETVYLGRNLLKITDRLQATSDYYPTDYSHRLYRENRVRGFVNVKTWLDFLKKGDLNFGTRIHGNIAGILSGVPAFIVAPDSRVLELVKYHNIPYTTIKKLDISKNIFQLVDKIDFSSIQKGHNERFENYLNFLNSNGLSTVFNHPDYESQTLKYDSMINESEQMPPISPGIYQTFEKHVDSIKVWDWLIETERNKIEFLKNERVLLKDENAKLRGDLEHLRRRSLYYIARRAGSKAIRLFR